VTNAAGTKGVLAHAPPGFDAIARHDIARVEPSDRNVRARPTSKRVARRGTKLARHTIMGEKCLAVIGCGDADGAENQHHR
jgi:hypothetical protein